jgi:cytochrome c
VLSDRNIAEVQQRLPNRNGMTRNHGLWDVKAKPDVANVACMKDCPVSGVLGSELPEHAQESHGNLADQQRTVGPTRGGNNGKVAAVTSTPAVRTADLARQKACMSCHGMDKRIVGPAFKEVAAKYRGQAGAEGQLVEKLKRGGVGAWGSIPMPANPDLAEQDARELVRWVLSGAL